MSTYCIQRVLTLYNDYFYIQRLQIEYLLCTTRPYVAFEVFYMYLVYTPEGIILANGILYYLSGVVVLKPTSTDLYLERRLLDMRTGAPDWPPAKM